jgi:uncharacterized membrane protein
MMHVAWAIAAGLGVVAGLRTMTAPAVVSWAAHAGMLPVQDTRFAFLASWIAVAGFTAAALGEYVVDLLPRTPDRTAPGPLAARIVSGACCGAITCSAAGVSMIPGALLGGVGAVIGAFGGYQARRRLVRALRVKDALVAIPEDLLAIAIAVALVFRAG